MNRYKTRKYSIFIIIILFLTFIAGCSTFLVCNKDKLSDGDYETFIVNSFKGELLEFEQVQTGSIHVSKENRKKILKLTDQGDLKYSTSEVVNQFNERPYLKLKDGNGFCTRFVVPEIDDNDYVILEAVIKLPKKIKMGKQKNDIVQGSFHYDVRNSGKLEYIWFLFDENAKAMNIKGDWSLTIYCQDVKVLSKQFKVL